ncbi:UPF0524 protein C3orf70 A [Merluccius polli]|uniref:UPF0524 protein C3orf70 A n=1 Tax=Merluccius polli TaxID=89951 RepID=A0AA47N1Y6_MERPO|nr:UPF0524 protein C3orf70 A [Merluccius polli]
MAAAGAARSLRTEKLDEAQASARSCAGRPDFLPSDGLSVRHGRCFKLHWCCHLGWCHCEWWWSCVLGLDVNVSVLLRVGPMCCPDSVWIMVVMCVLSRLCVDHGGKYVYQPMTSVCQLPSTVVPLATTEYSATMDLSVSLAERFLKMAPCFQSPPHLRSPKYCVIADLFVDDYIVKRINGKMCYVQRPPPPLPDPPHPTPPSSDRSAPQTRPPPAPAPQTPNSPPPAPQTPSRQQAEAVRPSRPPPPPTTGHAHKHPGPLDELKGPKIDLCSSPSSSEDSGINALDVEEEEDEADEDELSTDGNSSLWDQDECSLLSPSKSMIEIIEKIETTV